MRGVVDKLDEGNDRAKHHAEEQTEGEHADESHKRYDKLGAIASPELLQSGKFKQASYRHQNDRGQDRLRQRA